MATLFSLPKDVATSKFTQSAICYALAITMLSSVINALFGSTNGDGYVVHVSCNAMQAIASYIHIVFCMFVGVIVWMKAAKVIVSYKNSCRLLLSSVSYRI
eukprot:704188_1